MPSEQTIRRLQVAVAGLCIIIAGAVIVDLGAILIEAAPRIAQKVAG